MKRNFVFIEDLICDPKEALQMTVPASVSSKAELLERLSRGLSFPDTFGANWDALYDCLCDLGWVKQKQIVIVHEGVPSLPDDDLRVYLDVLNDAVASWRDNPGAHELIAAFPKSATMP